jgi:hypothetical protein
MDLRISYGPEADDGARYRIESMRERVAYPTHHPPSIGLRKRPSCLHRVPILAPGRQNFFNGAG